MSVSRSDLKEDSALTRDPLKFAKNKCKNNLFNAKINITEVFQLFL